MKLGELELNKIYCMDCLEGLKLIPDESVDLIVTDPPYNINFKPQRDTFDIIENDNMSWDDFDTFMSPIIKELYRVLKNNSVAYIFTGFSSSSSSFYKYCIEAGFTVKCQIVWVKNNFGIGYHFRPQHEDCWACFKGNPEKPLKAISSVIHEKKINGVKLVHSCQKPVKLLKILIKQYAKKGAIILDPFMGSGSSAVACKELEMYYIGFEISKEFVDISNERLQQENIKQWIN